MTLPDEKPDLDGGGASAGAGDGAGASGAGAGFGPNAEEVSPHVQRLLRIATTLSVLVATVLIASKGVAWFMTGAVSVLSALIDSIMDVAASLVNLFAVRRALRPADVQHRFGHGKAEPLAALVQAAFVAGSSLYLVVEVVGRIVEPRAVTHELVGVAVMVISIVLTLGLVAFQTYVVRRTSSVAISADSLHYKGDILIHAGVIVSLFLSTRFGIVVADPLIGICIAIYLFWNVWRIVQSSLGSLMDRELSQEDRARIIEIALAHPEVCDIHDLRTRQAGPRAFIQFHLELPKDISLMHAHEISDEVEAKVRAAFPGGGVIIHQDPEGIMEHRATFVGEGKEAKEF
ncbi:MAG: cation diffusion facilitator family transporter [Alphaproteobacteria bacterium]|nr:cation diffusion facilitator family transporter [Alphaproteobacteria bacterium]